ncbi:GvpL/GvpF family gas vesicle protein [Nocardia takedensis]
MGAETSGVYVYGIVPADVEPEPDVTGVGDPPAPVTVVRHGQVAALVSPLGSTEALGTPEDLTAHAELLDGSASVAPVLPLRFGAVMTDADAVESELLEANEDRFRAALAELEDRAQFVVRGRYVEQTLLPDLLGDDPEAARLHEQIRGRPEDATRDARIALGELINAAIERERARDTARVIEALGDLDVLINPREPSHEEDAVHVAVLIHNGDRARFEDVLRELTADWDGKVDLALLGPMAAYDFVTAPAPEG